MTGILLLSHGNACEGVLHSLSMIMMGACEKAKAIPLQVDDNLDEWTEQVKAAIDELDEGEGVLIMVDIVGGTPFNRSAALMREKNIAVVSGLNLPMLMIAIEERISGAPLSELADNCVEGGKEGIKNIMEFIQ